MLLELVIAQPVDGVVVVSIIGELDMASAPTLRARLITEIAAASVPLIVLDLAGVDLLDPTGLGVIFDGVKRTRARGGDLALARAMPHVEQDLALMRVTEILPSHESIETAAAALAPRATCNGAVTFGKSDDDLGPIDRAHGSAHG